MRLGQRGPKAEERAAAPASAVVFALMGVCLLLILLAWDLVRLWSTTAAAVGIANWGEDG